jgi:DNA-binding transcriptional regulator GbsR (MarR family)
MDDDRKIDKTREKVRRARAAYEQALNAQADTARIKELKAELYDAETELARVKRAQESAPPGTLL